MMWILLLQGCVGLGSDVSAGPVKQTESPEEQTTQFARTRPLFEQPLANGTPVAGLPNIRSETCGACHQAIYEQWSTSTHAAAWTDRQFQAEITKSGNRWLCMNCHTPLLAQQEKWPIGLIDGDVEQPIYVANPDFDPLFQAEGIGCASCHVRDGSIRGTGDADPEAAPHGVVPDPSLSTVETCNRCHQAEQDYPGKNFVCTFQTGSEWAAGPYAAEGTGCIQCHMPSAEHPVVAGGQPQTIAQHWWKGAGIPKVAGVGPPASVPPPPGLSLAAVWQGQSLQLTMTNANAGHWLPSGDPERWIEVRVSFVDSKLNTVGDWAHQIRQHWTWNPPQKQSDNRLKPRESRVVQIPVPVGATAAVVVAESHRMSRQNADYHNLVDYPLSIETHRFQVMATGIP